MSEYRLSRSAQRDLTSIWDYTVEHWGLRQAEKYLREIQSALEDVADEVGLGRRRDEVREGYRSYAVGSHTVFYRQRSNGIEVVRILHQRMDPDRHL